MNILNSKLDLCNNRDDDNRISSKQASMKIDTEVYNITQKVNTDIKDMEALMTTMISELSQAQKTVSFMQGFNSEWLQDDLNLYPLLKSFSSYHNHLS